MPGKVFVVDDDHLIIEVITQALSGICAVTGILDSAKAAERIKAENPDMLILDFSMPQISGLELLEQVRRDGYKNPVLMLTSNCDMELASKLLASGASEFVTKPFEVAVLRRIVEDKLHIVPAAPDTPWTVKE